MIVADANSIRFRVINDELPSFGNTLLANEQFYNDKINHFCMRWLPTDKEKVQIKSDSAVVPTVTATKANNSTVNITCAQVSAYNGLYFFEFEVDFSLFLTETYITVTQGTDVYRSEPFYGDLDLLTELENGDSQKIEYFNFDNAFQVDFSTDIVFTLYVPAILKDYGTDGEISVYDNQDELTKLKETAQRLLTFRTLAIPRYLAETLKLASSMDNFIINRVSYTRPGQPELPPIDGSNFVDYSMVLADKMYLGTNSHDVGYDCDESSLTTEIMNLKEDNASGSVTFNIPAGYLVHVLRADWVSGTAVGVKLGTTLGGSELVSEFEINATITATTVSIHSDINRTTNADIYLTVTGGVSNIDLQLIRNIE